jgi:predicted DNA repair protein MutK
MVSLLDLTPEILLMIISNYVCVENFEKLIEALTTCSQYKEKEVQLTVH